MHSIAFAKREDLAGRPTPTSSEGWDAALGSSAYTLVSLTQAARPFMKEAGGGSRRDAELSGRRARGAGLQRHGSCQGGAGVERAVSGVRPVTGELARERGERRTDQDTGG